MQNILVAGVYTPQQVNSLLTTINQMLAVTLTVYTPLTEIEAWPQDVAVIAGDLTDTAGLTAAAVDQDLVLVQLDSRALTDQTQSLTAALSASGQPKVVVASPDSVLSLTAQPVKWYQQHRQHQQHQQLGQVRALEQAWQQSGLDFTLIEGQTAMDTAIYTRSMATDWLTAVPTRRTLQLWDYLTVGLTWPLAA
ncbi:NAD(P)H-binding protein [Lactiplantibacillus daowaiensis]|uniref:NAD(P)H-binding protein n=1 Tax=Lactiplantibacillus daowaiensis TaxID=2559918 RepID=A0ABW1RXS5_9LACO|nr:NAD(P)H-binding protein [Lactiplantibacillus daowaiensis]